MSKKVFKYPLLFVDGWQSVDMPNGAHPVFVAMQHGKLTVWAEVDTEEPLYPVELGIWGTGHNIPDDAEHVGSTLDGLFVWHVWRRKESKDGS